MFARVRSNSLYGIEAKDVIVEVDVSKGVRSFSIVGLPDMAIRESIKRVTSSMINSGFRFPRKKITVNLAPADMKKQGSYFDLPIALGILASEDEALKAALADKVICGELSLNGALRPLMGTLSRAQQARSVGLKDFILPAMNAFEASLVSGISPWPVRSLVEAAAFLKGEITIAPPRFDMGEMMTGGGDGGPDFSEVKGQLSAKRGLEVAAAGGHNVIMIGPPGTGKTMLASRLPGILPDMTPEEVIEATKIHSAAGRLPPGKFFVSERPYRAPHHTISFVGLIGGSNPIMPGEISMSHKGVLFLDELAEYHRDVLEMLREPLEEKRIIINRACGAASFPTDFVFVAAMNPCPCGNLTHPKKECHCTPPQIQRYLSKISGPLLDRIDIHLEIPPLDYNELTREEAADSSAAVKGRVVAAREIQRVRYAGIEARVNAGLKGRDIKRFCRLDAEGRELLKLAITELGLSARAYDKVLKIARTIADLAGSDEITAEHISEAVAYRTLDRSLWLQ